MSKRALSAKFISKPIPAFDLINYSARFKKELDGFFGPAPTFPTRHPLHEYVSETIGEAPITYLEFGVWQGETFNKWLEMNRNADSRFYGFDSFEGLPEDWENQPRGTFSTSGQTPDNGDPRGQFVKGWFQDTLYAFLEGFKPVGQVVVHIDCDLYSSTLFVLSALDRHMPAGTIFIFDDFSSLDHEFAAWLDYRRSFNRTWEPVGLVAEGIQSAVRMTA